MVKVSEKYSNKTENDTKKIVISDEAYAICELLEELITTFNKIKSQLRG